MSGALTTADKQLAVVEYRLAELDLSDDNEDEDEDESAAIKDGALRQLQEERKALDSSRKLLEELLARSQEDVVTRSAGGNSGASITSFSANNSGFQAQTVNGGIGGMTFGRK